jgi:ubiquinone/menaquinone biosynthesis C-methylase UbiE
MPPIDWNRRMWNDPATWIDRGDEWQFHACHSLQPYDSWKQSVVTDLIDPYVGNGCDVLELGPGYGRWSEFLVDRAHSLALVDLNETCIDACRERFGEKPNLTYLVNDGRSLPVPDGSADLIWSFAALVHVDAPEIDFYLGEFARVLRPGGHFVAHHAGWFTWEPGIIHQVRFALASRIKRGQWRGKNDRSVMSARHFAAMAERRGLRVERVIRTWGEDGRYSLALGDVITIGSA